MRPFVLVLLVAPLLFGGSQAALSCGQIEQAYKNFLESNFKLDKITTLHIDGETALKEVALLTSTTGRLSVKIVSAYKSPNVDAEKMEASTLPVLRCDRLSVQGSTVLLREPNELGEGTTTLEYRSKQNMLLPVKSVAKGSVGFLFLRKELNLSVVYQNPRWF